MTPREFIKKSFSSAGDLPISGGWGLTQDDACIIDRHDAVALPGFAFNPRQVMATFVEKRIYSELIVSRDDGDRYSGISWTLHDREVIRSDDGRILEHAIFKISAFEDRDWEMLKAEWEGSNGYQTPSFDLQAHSAKRDSLKKIALKDFWFDVTSCYSQQLYDLTLPWDVLGFGRGCITDFESQHSGLGFSVAYSGLYVPEAQATVYFYTHGETNIPDDPTAEPVIAQLRMAVDDVMRAAGNVFKKDCTLLSTVVQCFPDGSSAWLCAEFELRSAAQENEKAFVFLRGHNDRYIKIRITIPDRDELKNLPAAFADFVLREVLKVRYQSD